MFESLSQRTVIIGNSGAGKSALAESLAALVHVPVIDLDLLNWREMITVGSATKMPHAE